MQTRKLSCDGPLRKAFTAEVAEISAEDAEKSRLSAFLGELRL
jgi:hypothetical protein